eukprot:TRINITY_DN4944_c0_g2_i14.p2 TRINITY_DN4944_c0_g2~~TRINITY_DN4944_c0_g2_i14.p2  ORF type:complete len:222 (-),score=47.13 TRINITY_DN4944_c0_g2_i14:131-796(-)
MLQDGDVIVDFCCGGGHLAILLAYLYPKCKVIMVDKNDVSLAYAVSRIESLGLDNVSVFYGDLFQFSGTKFQVGLAIHACGFLTDLVMDLVFENDAGYVVAPCCFGGMTNNQKISFPRSNFFLENGISLDDYMYLTSCADVNTCEKNNFSSENYVVGKKCMGFIDLDRNCFAREQGYSIFHYTMNPHTCTPKNDVISGIPEWKLKQISNRTLTKREMEIPF